MGLPKVSLALFLSITTIASINTCFAQNEQQEFLDAHNAARAQVGVEALQWDEQVATYARNYANQIQSANTCNNLVHSEGPYGENLAAATPDLSAGQAVKMWVDEQQYYDYQSNSCVGGEECGHYTQVVWRNSVRLGCARVRCDNGWWYVICSYDPPGNVQGQSPY